MKKLKLELESLVVESFEATDASGEPGTVHANGGSNNACQSQISCLADTCYFWSCFDTDCYCSVDTACASCGHTYCTCPEFCL